MSIYWLLVLQSVVLFGVINRTQRHRVLVWRFCFTVCFPPVILRILPWLSSAAFGCWPSSIALSKHTGVRNCCSVFSIFPYPFPAFLPSPHARFRKFYFSFHKLFFKIFPHRINPNPRHFPRLNPDSALFPALSVLILCVNPTYFLFNKHTLANTLVIYTFWNRNFSQQLIVCTPPVGCVRFAGRFRSRGLEIR